jgi:hypothetical protein
MNSRRHTDSLFCVEEYAERIDWIAISEGVAARDRLDSTENGHIRRVETVTLLTISAL